MNTQDRMRYRRMRTLQSIAKRYHPWLNWEMDRASGYHNPRHAVRISNQEFDRLMVHTSMPFDMLGLANEEELGQFK